MATRERGEPCGVRSALDSASAHTLTTEPPRAQRTLRILSVTISAWIGRHHLCVLCALCGSRFNSSAPEPTTPDSLRPMQNLAEPSGNPAAICESIHSGRGPQSLSPLAVGQLAGGLRPSTVGSRPLLSRATQSSRYPFAAGSPGGSTSRNSGNCFHFGTGGVWPSPGTYADSSMICILWM